MSVGAVVAFWGLSLLLVLTPGADWAYMIAAGLRGRAVWPAAAGLVLGYLVLTAVVAGGVAALVAGSPVALTALTLLGAGYLIWLGLTSLLRPAGLVSAAPQAAVSWPRAAAAGSAISALNPKGLLLFLAVLPQFTTGASVWPIGAQMLLLGAVHSASCLLVYLAVGGGARAVLSARPGWARIVSRVSGAAMLAIGSGLLIEQFAA